ncbi:MAG: hemerythrin domain-containing protein [Bdellovibrionota bacterium]
MTNVIEDFFKSIVPREALPLEDVRLGLDEALIDEMELMPLMERHHGFLEESIEVLMRKDALDIEKQDHLFRFFRLLEMHGKAEEEVLYTALRSHADKDARLAGFAAQDEHDVAFRIERELLEMGYRDTWNEEIEAKAKVVASLVKNHIKEEESEIFPLAEKLIPQPELERMSETYCVKCKIYLSDSLQTSISHPLTRMSPAESKYPH